MSECCMINCCIKDGCKCRESKHAVFICCIAKQVRLAYTPKCNQPGGCKSDTFDCGHECCNIKPYGCCNPCYKPGGCELELYPISFECHENQQEWYELFNQ